MIRPLSCSKGPRVRLALDRKDLGYLVHRYSNITTAVYSECYRDMNSKIFERSVFLQWRDTTAAFSRRMKLQG